MLTASKVISNIWELPSISGEGRSRIRASKHFIKEAHASMHLSVSSRSRQLVSKKTGLFRAFRVHQTPPEVGIRER